MTLLEIIKEFSRRTGLIVPVAVASSGDDQVLQIMGLANEILDNLEERKTYTFLTQEATFPSVLSESQGLLSTLAPGFMALADNLLYNRTERELIFGPIGGIDWQSHQAGIWTISETKYRFRNGYLFLSPVPAAGSVVAFEYKSSYTVLNESTGTLKQYFNQDTDTCAYPDKLLILGLRWRWKREKGLRYAEDLRDYEVAVANFCGNDGGHETINLSGESAFGPGVNVPERNWSL